MNWKKIAVWAVVIVVGFIVLRALLAQRAAAA